MVCAENFNLDEHTLNVLSTHHLFWVKRDGSRVLVCRTGDLVSAAKLERYPKLETETLVNLERVEEIASLFLQLKEIQRPKDKMILVAKIRASWAQWFLSEEKVSPLELILVCEKLMGSLMKEHADEWSEASLALFHRSCLVATLSVMGVASLGYASWKYLESIWTISFSHNAKFKLTGMNYSSLEKLDKSRTQSIPSTIEVKPIQTDYQSLDFASSLVFEKADGSGQPRGTTLSELSDSERWFAHVQNNISWNLDLTSMPNTDWAELWTKDNYNILKKLYDAKKEAFENYENTYLEFGL